jgi:hypothetical protein
MPQMRFFTTFQNCITFTTWMKEGVFVKEDLLGCSSCGFHYLVETVSPLQLVDNGLHGFSQMGLILNADYADCASGDADYFFRF